MSNTIYGTPVGTPISPKKIEEVLNPVKTVNGQAPDDEGNVDIEIPEGGGNVDLTGYATESFVERYVDGVIKNMGEVGGFATEHFVESKISGLAVEKTEDMTQPVGIDANRKLWVAPGADGKDGHTPVKGVDYFTDSDKAEIVDAVKVAVPLVKVAEQPTFVSSVEEMTDTSKAYVLTTDMSMWAYMKAESYTLTADDFTVGGIGSYGDIEASGNNRIITTELWSLTDKVVSVNCPSPYQYIVYYFSSDSGANSAYLGKTVFKSGSIDDVTADTIASGSLSGAAYCRVSLRDSSKYTGANLTNRVDAFMANVKVKQSSASGYCWRDTGHTYNQPSDYEGRIVALEKALEGIENGTY